jgi:hypothetical protein
MKIIKTINFILYKKGKEKKRKPFGRAMIGPHRGAGHVG